MQRDAGISREVLNTLTVLNTFKNSGTCSVMKYYIAACFRIIQLTPDIINH